jgi:hypothetical protein
MTSSWSRVRYGWVKQADGKWDSTKRVWEIHYDQAVALGLKKRIVKAPCFIKHLARLIHLRKGD